MVSVALGVTVIALSVMAGWLVLTTEPLVNSYSFRCLLPEQLPTEEAVPLSIHVSSGPWASTLIATRVGKALSGVLNGRAMAGLALGGLILSIYLFFWRNEIFPASGVLVVVGLLLWAFALSGEPVIFGGGIPPARTYNGDFILPRKIYSGEPTEVTLKLTDAIRSYSRAVLKLLDDQKDFDFSREVYEVVSDSPVPRESMFEPFVEAVLSTTGIVIKGNRQQSQRLVAPDLQYQWTCCFPSPGDYVLAVEVKAEYPEGSYELASVEDIVRVIRIAGLSRQHVLLIARLAALFAGVLFLVDVFRALGAFSV